MPRVAVGSCLSLQPNLCCFSFIKQQATEQHPYVTLQFNWQDLQQREAGAAALNTKQIDLPLLPLQ